MANTAALWYFESVDLYKILCPHKVKSMADKHTFNYYQQGQFIYFPDEPATHIYMIVNGRVKLGHYLDDGKEVVTAILTTGEIFGELALAGEDKRRDFARTLDGGTICMLSLDDMKALMKQNHELSFKMLKFVGLKLMKLERRLELLVFKDARTRVVEFIKDTASWNGKKVGFETLIPTKLTHQEIAQLTGTSRQTVTTILNELKEKNLINFDRKRILVRDLEALN